MIRVPGQRPHIHGVSHKEGAEAAKAAAKPQPAGESIVRPQMDAHAIAIRLAAFATKAREKELNFKEIIQKVIEMTGIDNPQAAMEEANRKLQKEIDDTLASIKENKELMEEAESWQSFADLLEKGLPAEQLETFLELLRASLKSI